MIYHTHKAIEHMTAAGVPLAQAEAIAEAYVMIAEDARKQAEPRNGIEQADQEPQQ